MIDDAPQPRRFANASQGFHPRYVVWELTLKCDLACRHCGSRAGKARPSELTVDQCLEIVDKLAEMGTKELVFIGGEAYLYPKWLQVVRAAADAGIRCLMTTGGRNLTPALAKQAAAAGMKAISVSVDGMETTHDRLRAVPGSWKRCFESLQNIQDAGMIATSNTQFNRLNMNELEPLGERLIAHGVKAWQVQVTGPMGRAADQQDWLFQPYDMLTFMPRLAALATHAKTLGVEIQAANNMGYFGPYEHLLRPTHFKGCVAGSYVLGIEADGSVKGCPSLPSGPYVGGKLTEMSLEEIWNHTDALTFTRGRGTEDLWGFCKTCYYAEECKGGCSWTAHTLLGKRGNMPYCHHRALELQQRGIRERLIKVEEAPGKPFDFGRFEIVEEPFPDPSPSKP